MSDRMTICEAVEDRLLEGDRLTGHPELVEHAGSCLECFRTLSELRELPRLAEALRTGAAMAAEESDPGPAFWKVMPERIADEVLGAPKAPATPVVRPARRWWAPALLGSLGVWAAAAAVLVLGTRGESGPAPSALATAPAPVTATLAAGSESDENLPMGKLASLDTPELRALNSRLTEDGSATLRLLEDPAADVAAEDDGDATALEQLARLDGVQLRQLTHRLGLELE
ncbi:MAG TPA: hypothetical protein VMU50_12240 [Polyangia bacterium]|nr:hypothetical protein [Polyangia bacterium]